MKFYLLCFGVVWNIKSTNICYIYHYLIKDLPGVEETNKNDFIGTIKPKRIPTHSQSVKHKHQR